VAAASSVELHAAPSHQSTPAAPAQRLLVTRRSL
jgi:hypothetical protein